MPFPRPSKDTKEGALGFLGVIIVFILITAFLAVVVGLGWLVDTNRPDGPFCGSNVQSSNSTLSDSLLACYILSGVEGLILLMIALPMIALIIWFLWWLWAVITPVADDEK